MMLLLLVVSVAAAQQLGFSYQSSPNSQYQQGGVSLPPGLPAPGPQYPNQGFPSPSPDGSYSGLQVPSPGQYNNVPSPTPTQQQYNNGFPSSSTDQYSQQQTGFASGQTYNQGSNSFPVSDPSYSNSGFPSPSPSHPGPGFPAPGPSYPGPGFPAPSPSYPGAGFPAPGPSYPGPGFPAPSPSYPGPSFPAPGGNYGSFPGPAPSAQYPLQGFPGQYGGQQGFPGQYGGQQGGYGGQGQGADTSDPCFRKYSNCIIVNAQPYERRSTVDIQACKQLCLSSNTGIFQCRSFVYDNVNQVCDLFGHVGNQYPARLIQFNGRDYYEPTGQCGGSGGGSSGYGNNGGGDGSGPTCPAGQEARMLRIEGFQLQGANDVILSGLSVDQCVDACINNQGPDGQAAPCQSFDYTNNNCMITTEAAVPAGNGQLTQSPNSDYFEKICVDAQTAANCPRIFDRFPQMILVGFAETVVDAQSFEECLDNCLNSQQLYNFRCISGMYYFQEEQLNCILNSEDRSSQPELFVEEQTDIVDYFETGCTARSLAASRLRRLGIRQQAPRRYASGRERVALFSSGTTQLDVPAVPLDEPVANVTDGLLSSEQNIPAPRRAPLFDSWTQWSPCEHGRQIRYRRCMKTNLRSCPSERRECESGNKAVTEETEKRYVIPSAALHAAATSSEPTNATLPKNCAPGECCAIFGGCRLGLKQDIKTYAIRWCTDPCRS